MANIYAIGEVVFDIIFKDGRPMTGNAGGSMLNTAVSLGRLGAPSCFVGETGNDEIGRMIKKFLEENNVSIQHLTPYKGHNTGIALAFLDEENNAIYSFYKDYPANRLENVAVPYQKGDFVLFGSSFAFNSNVRPWLLQNLKIAKEAGATIIYDPNYRNQKHLTTSEQKQLFIENCSFANIIRASQEDFDTLFTRQSAIEAWELVKSFGNCQALVYTMNSEGAHIITASLNKQYAAPKITPISTVGAGDTFNAALLWKLWEKQIQAPAIQSLTSNDWDEIAHAAINCATDVCLSLENYISTSYAQSIKRQ